MTARRVVVLEKLAENKWPDTSDLVDSIFEESTRGYAWRPKRAAIAHAEAFSVCWMKPEEFTHWLIAGRASARKLRVPLPHVALSLNRDAVGDYQAGRRSVPKITALACAHWAFNLTPPTFEDESFDQWFAVRFGEATKIEEWLNMARGLLPDYLRGFEIRSGSRVDKIPHPTLIRALDWVWRKGPFVPYGERAPEVFPGQVVPYWL